MSVRLFTIAISGVLGLGALLVGWAYLHRAVWYGQDFSRAFRQRIESELLPGQTAEMTGEGVAIREVGQGQRLVCATVRVREGERSAGRFRYAIQFWPTLFGGGATDIASPRVAGADNLDLR